MSDWQQALSGGRDNLKFYREIKITPCAFVPIADLEKMKQYLREYRERYVTSAAVDAEIKRLIGE